MKKYGVIMAGGGGTRFWPLSRQKKPKQLLNLTGNGLMVDEAVERLASVVGADNIFIVTSTEQAELMTAAASGKISAGHILTEPEGRNTAACIGYAAMEILKKYGDGVMVVTPSDHYIQDNAEFGRVLELAAETAGQTDKLVTVGISPTFPATGYGYIRYGSSAAEIKPVEEFVEKPDLEHAKKYVESGKYAWNSGMFVWKASVILDRFREYIPDIYAQISEIGEAMGSSREAETISRIYPQIRKISVDYAVMEPSAAKGGVLVIPAEFGWDDVGSLDMMDVLHEKDENGNVLIGDAIALETSDTIVYSSSKPVTVLGAEGLVVVETPDVIMVCSKERAQEVRKIVELLDKSGRKDLL